jgi:hypothetical protein
MVLLFHPHERQSAYRRSALTPGRHLEEGIMNMPLRIRVACLALLVLSSRGWAQDPGIPDTIRLGVVPAGLIVQQYDPYDTSVAVPITLANDEELQTLVIPLLLDGSSGWARFDSVSYVSGRLSDPAVLDAREAFVFATDAFSVASIVLKFTIASGASLPAGSGKLCDLWFSPLFGGIVEIDSLSDSPYGALRLTSAAMEEFTPQFQTGGIDIACNYLVGNVRNYNQTVNIEDYLGLQKGYHGCSPLGGTRGALHLADVNCDRHVDLRDAGPFYNYAIFGIPLCECGSYVPALYGDPGLPDTVWMESDTLYIGVEDTIDVGVINDEPLAGLALAFEMEGTGALYTQWPSGITDRVPDQLQLLNYDCFSPYIFTFFPSTCMAVSPSVVIEPGSGAIMHAVTTATAPGVVNFRLTTFQEIFEGTSYDGPESMLLTPGNAAILPTFVGGYIVARYLCGDVNHDRIANVGDAVFIVNNIFRGGNAPDPVCLGDANGDGVTDVGDVVYIINYVFKGGPAPTGDCCP